MPHPPYTGRLATVADTRRVGAHRIEVECAGRYCHRRGRFTFDELELPDDAIMISIEHVRRFQVHQVRKSQGRGPYLLERLQGAGKWRGAV